VQNELNGTDFNWLKECVTLGWPGDGSKCSARQIRNARKSAKSSQQEEPLSQQMQEFRVLQS
jgi:hypothetical protein